MVQDGVQWFGSLTPDVPVEVSNAATFVSQEVPSTMVPGRWYMASVTMQNTSGITWTAGQLFRLGSQDPQDNTTWGFNRVGLPGPVAPGQQVTFTFTFTAPAWPATYNFQWRMVQDGVQWFGDFTTDVTVVVLAMLIRDSRVTSSEAATAGTVLNSTVPALDAENNMATEHTGTVDFTGTDPAATLPKNYPFTAADKGEHTHTIIPQAAGALTTQFADKANPTIDGSATDTVVAPILGPATNYSTGLLPPTAVVTGDFNHDGKPDLILVDGADNDIRMLLGDGDGRWRFGGIYAVGGSVNTLAVSDFDGDGKTYFTVADSGGLSILLNKS
jgi:hypothetical protein